MPLNYSASKTSRIQKSSSKNPFSRRSSASARTLSSPFSANPRRKPVARAKSKPEISDTKEENDFEGRLSDTGLVTTMSFDLSLRDVPQAMGYILANMFTQVPDQRSGLNSTRVMEIHSYRSLLPPIISIPHVHALLNVPTTTEREIAELTRKSIVRKLVVPGRGAGGAGVGEGLVLVESWDRIVKESQFLDDSLKNRFLEILHSNPLALTLPCSEFSMEDATTLMRAGFLTFSTQTFTSVDLYSRPDTATLGTLSSLSGVGYTGASGTLAAVGGSDAVHRIGGGGWSKQSEGSNASAEKSNGEIQELARQGGSFHLSLPTTGPYLRLLALARVHLLSLLSKSKYSEAPVSLLRERWDGGIAGDDQASLGKRARGEFIGVLPGRTRKWRQFYGLNFEWVMGECVGAGLIELFETGSVGKGARATGRKG
jgi:Serine-threonine protein kinase 19